MISGKVIESLGGGTFLALGVESLLMRYTRQQGGKAWKLMDSILLKLWAIEALSCFTFFVNVFSHNSAKETSTHSTFLLIHQLLPAPTVSQEWNQLLKFVIWLVSLKVCVLKTCFCSLVLLGNGNIFRKWGPWKELLNWHEVSSHLDNILLKLHHYIQSLKKKNKQQCSNL